MYGIVGTDNPFVSIYNGFLGIAPYDHGEAARREMSFLYQLKKNKMIDHIIISFYVRPGEGKNSQIKFGSYDKSAFTGTMSTFHTVSKDSWVLRANQF